MVIYNYLYENNNKKLDITWLCNVPMLLTKQTESNVVRFVTFKYCTNNNTQDIYVVMLKMHYLSKERFYFSDFHEILVCNLASQTRTKTS